MPAIFYREAFQAAAGEKPREIIGDEHLTRYENLPEALDRDRSEPLDLVMQVRGGIVQVYRHIRMSRHYSLLGDTPSSRT